MNKLAAISDFLGLGAQNSVDAFSAIQLQHHQALQQEAIKDHRWHREQVQRRERAKYYGGCTPESWCPADCEIPCDTCDEEGDDMGVNITGSSFVGDDAIEKLAKLLNPTQPEEPEQPEQPQPQPPVVIQPPFPGWLRTLLTLLAVLLGALIVLWAYQLFGGSPDYDVIADPWIPARDI